MLLGVVVNSGKTMKKYIVLEGTEGVGKTTVADLIEAALRMRNNNVLRVREPGSTPLAEKLRTLALHDPNPRSSLTEMMLFLAARASLMDLINETTADIIVTDRAWPTTFALQVNDDRTQVMYDRTVNILRPDAEVFAVLLTCTYDTYVSRRGSRRDDSDVIEARMKDAEIFEHYQDRYRKACDYDLVIATDNISQSDVVGEIMKCLFP